MTSKHSFLAAAACALPLSIAACGGGSDTTAPEGTHHGYVVSSASVPTSDVQARDFSLDLGTKTSSKQDGMGDNALGLAISALTMLNFDIQGTVTTAVDTGSILLLLDFQTKDFTNASSSGFGVKLGAMPTPAACSGPTDTVCRHHLDGSASFQLAANSPTDVVTGPVVNGTFNGGPGDLTLQIAIGSATAPISLNLVRARVRATAITETGITAIIGGLVTQDELMNQIGPAIQVQVAGILARDCTPAGPPPGCGCHGTGATVISFDTDADCKLSTAEILGTPVVKSLLQADACSTDSCKTADSLSIGVKVQAVAAKFPM
jgi:hypothetical protein